MSERELIPRLDAAFEAWIEAQRAAIETVRTAQGVPRSDTDNAEGYRWVTRLTSLAWEWFLEKSDPLHPQVFLLQDAHRKLLVDNPDVGYWFCVLDDRHLYRMTGTRGEAPYVGLTFGTPMAQGPAGGRTGTTAQAHLDQFELGPNGEVDVLIGPADLLPTPGPQLGRCWSRARPGGLPGDLLRQAHQPGCELKIELVGKVDPPVLDVEDFASQARDGRRSSCSSWRPLRSPCGTTPSTTPTPSGAPPGRSTWPRRRTRPARTAPRT